MPTVARGTLSPMYAMDRQPVRSRNEDWSHPRKPGRDENSSGSSISSPRYDRASWRWNPPKSAGTTDGEGHEAETEEGDGQDHTGGQCDDDEGDAEDAEHRAKREESELRPGTLGKWLPEDGPGDGADLFLMGSRHRTQDFLEPAPYLLLAPFHLDFHHGSSRASTGFPARWWASSVRPTIMPSRYGKTVSLRMPLPGVPDWG